MASHITSLFSGISLWVTETGDQGPNLRLNTCLLHVSTLPLMSGLAGACNCRGGSSLEAQCSQSEVSVKLLLATCQSRSHDPTPKQLWKGRGYLQFYLTTIKVLSCFLGIGSLILEINGTENIRQLRTRHYKAFSEHSFRRSGAILPFKTTPYLSFLLISVAASSRRKGI